MVSLDFRGFSFTRRQKFIIPVMGYDANTDINYANTAYFVRNVLLAGIQASPEIH